MESAANQVKRGANAISTTVSIELATLGCFHCPRACRSA
jgi:hypothetical protein